MYNRNFTSPVTASCFKKVSPNRGVWTDPAVVSLYHCTVLKDAGQCFCSWDENNCVWGDHGGVNLRPNASWVTTPEGFAAFSGQNERGVLYIASRFGFPAGTLRARNSECVFIVSSATSDHSRAARRYCCGEGKKPLSFEEPWLILPSMRPVIIGSALQETLFITSFQS